MPVDFDVGLLSDRPIQETAALVRTAEELGYNGAWVPDSQSAFREGFMALAAAAAATSTIKIAAGVSNPVTRHPAVIASTFATLDEYSGGRAILGIGVGDSAVRTIGQPPAKLARFEEVIHALKALMLGETVEIDGTENRLPWSKRDVPIIVASAGPKSLQLAGRIADGVLFQVGAEPQLAAWAIENVRIGAEQAGRSFDDLKIYCRIATSVSHDREWARKQAHGYISVAGNTTFAAAPADRIPADLAADLKRMSESYDYFQHGSNASSQSALVTDRIIDAISIAGTPAEALPRFQELVALGVDGFVMVTTGSDPAASMETFATEVMPYLVE